jgi:AraC-like DNA-binding protein
MTDSFGQRLGIMVKGDSAYSSTHLAAFHHLPSTFVRVGPTMHLPELVGGLGYDPAPLFTSLGLDHTRFADPDYEIPFILSSRLLSRCTAATGCDHLGLLLGERAAISSLGLVGFMLQSAPTVGVALRALVRYLDLHDRGGLATLDIDGGVAQLGYSIILPEASAQEQIYDLAMTFICKLMRGLCGAQWLPTTVLLMRNAPQNAGPYQSAFSSRARFNQTHNATVFSAHWLDQPIAGADPLLYRYLEKEALEAQGRQLTTIVDDMRMLLHRSIAAGHCSATVVAKQLGMHERTLNRYLATANTTFRLELNRVRYEMAQEMLSNGAMQITQIADALDYAETSSFCRAFKRWSGLSPKDWRKSHLRSRAHKSNPRLDFTKKYLLTR